MPLKYKILIWIGVIFGLLSFIRPQLQSALAAITNSSRVIPYQGRLTDSGGNNVADGTYSMTFKIYTVSTGGSSSFTETHSSVSIASGLFSVLLGSLSANGVNLDFANPPYYLGITVGTNSEMTPRIQLGFAPLAHNAQYLDGTPLSSLALASSVVIDNSLANGRLTLTSGTPVTTTDVTAATTVYYTPYNGNRISLYDGTSAWSTLTFSELSLSLSGYTANKNYDIFAYNNSGSVALESLIWTNDTARATAVVLQDGIYVKSGATTRRLLGTIRITGSTGQSEDSLTKRFVSNLNNKIGRQFYFAGTSWSPSNGAYNYWAGNSAYKFEFVNTINHDPVVAEQGGSAYISYGGGNGSGQLTLTFGFDSASPDPYANYSWTGQATWVYYIGLYSSIRKSSLGYHYYSLLYYATGQGVSMSTTSATGEIKN